jgi:hypothetical protein
MEDLNDKQRQIIRLAFTSTDPDLRRKAVERVVTSRYKPEFLKVVLNQRFQHPETGNMVTWKSLPSQAQKAIYGEWEQAQEARGEGGGGGRGRDDGGDGGGGGSGDEPPKRGQKYADRTALYSKRGRKEDGAKVGLASDHELRELAVPSGMEEGQRQQANSQLDDATFASLKKLQERVQHAVDNPDGDYRRGLEGVGYTEDTLKGLGKALSKELRKQKGKRFHQDVLEAANANDLEEEDADVLEDFRRDKPEHGRHHTWPELFQKFLNHRLTTPETKERMKDMSINDFKKMYLSILKDEDEDVEEMPVAASKKAGEDESETVQVTIFDPPSVVEKNAKLTAEGRRLVRAAFHSKDQTFRDKLVKVARAELGT